MEILDILNDVSNIDFTFEIYGLITEIIRRHSLALYTVQQFSYWDFNIRKTMLYCVCTHYDNEYPLHLITLSFTFASDLWKCFAVIIPIYILYNVTISDIVFFWKISMPKIWNGSWEDNPPKYCLVRLINGRSKLWLCFFPWLIIDGRCVDKTHFGAKPCDLA